MDTMGYDWYRSALPVFEVSNFLSTRCTEDSLPSIIQLEQGLGVMGQGVCFQWPHLQIAEASGGIGHLHGQRHHMCVGLGESGVGGGRVVIGSSLLIQASAERTACPWPDAFGSWCIPRVIY